MSRDRDQRRDGPYRQGAEQATAPRPFAVRRYEPTDGRRAPAMVAAIIDATGLPVTVEEWPGRVCLTVHGTPKAGQLTAAMADVGDIRVPGIEIVWIVQGDQAIADVTLSPASKGR